MMRFLGSQRRNDRSAVRIEAVQREQIVEGERTKTTASPLQKLSAGLRGITWFGRIRGSKQNSAAQSITGIAESN
jgi:hypothetical protein